MVINWMGGVGEERDMPVLYFLPFAYIVTYQIVYLGAFPQLQYICMLNSNNLLQVNDIKDSKVHTFVHFTTFPAV